MTKDEYLISLAQKLQGISKNSDAVFDEIKKLVIFYEELINDKIEDGMSEEDAVSTMDAPDDIVERIKDELYAVTEEKKASTKTSGGVKLMARSSGKYTEMTAEFGDIDEIYLKDANHALNIYSGKSGKLEYTDGPSGKYNVRVEGKKLICEFEQEFHWFSFMGIQNKPVTLTLPESFVGDIVAKTTNARIEAEKVRFNSMKLTSSNGRISVKRVAVKNLAEIHTSNGTMEIEDVYAGSIDAHTSNGRISVQRIDSDDIRLDTSNGAVLGTLMGSIDDYAIQSSTSNGKNNLPRKSEGAKKLVVKTSNGKIELDFEK